MEDKISPVRIQLEIFGSRSKKKNDKKKKSAEAAHIHQKFMIDFIQFEN